jgi:crotonobetainyl-CoA:carnitine CoA-transferase CaiB-like acyl-CoA transferase
MLGQRQVAKALARRAPGLGKHNDEVLKELGFDEQAIASLHASGAVPIPKDSGKAA